MNFLRGNSPFDQDGYCKHGRLRRQCKDCFMGDLCEHGRSRRQCKDCGTGYCKHGRSRHQCKDCYIDYSEAIFCPHGNNQHICRSCRISAGACPHGVRRSICRTCAYQDLAASNHPSSSSMVVSNQPPTTKIDIAKIGKIIDGETEVESLSCKICLTNKIVRLIRVAIQYFVRPASWRLIKKLP